jgi:acetyl esterase/lipase
MKVIEGRLESGKTSPMPRIECWVPEGNHTGIGIVIFPGGGYGGLAEHEGKGYAEHFMKQGIACFVVTYRLATDGYKHPAMLEDALAAIGTIRASASDFGLTTDMIGVMGSSAGGHLAAHTLIAWDQYESDVSLRPDFGILCYPVIVSTGKYAHQGSMTNLLGDDPLPDLLDSVSCEKHISEKTPPCFIWHTCEDPGVPVENSMVFASALQKNGVPMELHLYTKGAHGLGLNTPFSWEVDCLRWLKEMFIKE